MKKSAAANKASSTKSKSNSTAFEGQKGIVAYFLDLGTTGRTAKQLSTPYVIEQVRKGLAYSELEALGEAFDMPVELLTEQIGVSRATIHRRKQNQAKRPLSLTESDRVVRLARLMGMALDVFEEKEYARRWMTTPQRGLGGAIPLDYAVTEVGAWEVRNLLGRIEHGVFS